MKKLALLVVALFCTSSFADDLPKIAVYVTSKMFEHENKVLEKKMVASLVRIGRYRVVDRSEESSHKLAAEHIKQRNGSVDEEQIKRLGKQYGVDFICLADITTAFGGFLVSASIVNVETAEIPFIGETSTRMMTLDDLSRALNEVLEMMFSSQTTAAATSANAHGEALMRPKHDDTEIWATEHFAASGSPIAIVGPRDVLTVTGEGKNYYKVRTAFGKEGFAVKRDLVSSITQFIDMRPEPPPVTRKEIAEKKQRDLLRISGQRPEDTGARLFIATLPEHADIYINGKLVGRSNEGELQVPVGTHNVRFVKNDVEKTVAMRFAQGKNPTKFIPLIDGAKELAAMAAKQQPSQTTGARKETVVVRKETMPALTEEQDNSPRILYNRLRVESGLGFIGLGVSGSISVPSENIYNKNPDTSIFDVTWRIDVDLIYAEMYLYAFGGYGGIQTNVHVLGKYPINLGFVKVFPLLGYSHIGVTSPSVMVQTGLFQFSQVKIGFEDNQFTLGGRVDMGISKTAYVSTDYLYSIGGGSNAQSFKLGVGLDLGIGKNKRRFWRPELMYHYTGTAYSDKSIVISGIEKTEEMMKELEGFKFKRSTHAVGLYIGVGYGYKLGGNKQSVSASNAMPAPSNPPFEAPTAAPAATPNDLGAGDFGSDDW